MTIVDGAVYSVPTAKKQEFIKHAQNMCALFKEYGALHVVDAWGIDVPDGDLTSFPMAVKCEPDETVCYSWMTWPSEQVRKDAWDKIMQDERMQQPMMFDGKRMIFGTFDVVAEAK
ncbi:DUF1428 domain-containing protein [Cohaesibacter celericrescens]|uniref:DUF1428 domain-containing protein n=1 Tax=Cohaesibacter celericrescens TaxID=2067669 RepID=A0A2N5XUK9_9HYPH|nr:DUF1428 domain-containing protein [Cohaesibacter celericrescens]PLW78184.1 DUF1428 domain-containing protein [Cohaesibacter celericrescens]